MNIIMATNTYTPHVGGVARSVQSFTDQFRRLGHRVLVVAPEFDDAPRDEEGVVRVPAIKNFNGSEFCVPLVVPGMLMGPLEEFQPEIIHCHHPFLLGSTSQRIAAAYELPIVFTHHTRYETYTHYLPVDNAAVQRFAVELATRFCSLCDAVIAPSQSIAELLRQHEVESLIEVIPTGVDVDRFLRGDGGRARRQHGIPPQAFVVGHVGRLAQEKNLDFLTQAVASFLQREGDAIFLVVGDGPSREAMEMLFDERGLRPRLVMTGKLEGDALADVYAAMDVFAFASQSETQGMVLTEAMAAGVPVVAVDASGVRDVVQDGINGRLLPREDLDSFVAALEWTRRLTPAERSNVSLAVHATAEEFSMRRCAKRMLALYGRLVRQKRREVTIDDSPWAMSMRWIEEQVKIVSNYAGAVGAALSAADEAEAGQTPQPS
jgi:glycosyltransferase involved in cell wall biosynthesis